jgi:hypothetical protein
MLEAAKARPRIHHQPEAQHPKSSAIHKLAGRLPHLLGVKRTSAGANPMSDFDPKRTLGNSFAGTLI